MWRANPKRRKAKADAVRRAIVTAALALTAVGCGSSTSNPSAPAPTTPQWALSGTVRSNGSPLVAASVTVSQQPLPILVTQTATDGGGRYSFSSIAEGSYFVQAGAVGYVTVILPITLNASKTVDFALPLNPR
jgi:Carboxypeptidase regulatory-like domain